MEDDVAPAKRPTRKFKNLDKPWEDDSVDHWKQHSQGFTQCGHAGHGGRKSHVPPCSAWWLRAGSRSRVLPPGDLLAPRGSSRHTHPANPTPVPVACRNEPFAKEDMKNPLTEASSFAVLFPAYREKYLREAWPQVTSLLKDHNLSCQVPLRARARGHCLSCRVPPWVPTLGLGQRRQASRALTGLAPCREPSLAPSPST